MADKKEKLFSDFSPVSTEQWMEKVTADLKGADFEKKLVWKTNEGFKVKPFYRMEDLEGLKTTDALQTLMRTSWYAPRRMFQRVCDIRKQS